MLISTTIAALGAYLANRLASCFAATSRISIDIDNTHPPLQ